MQTAYSTCTKTTLAAIAVAATLAGTGPARGASIIQDQRGGASQILYASPVGQTFTAQDPHILSVGFWVEDFNPSHAPADFAVDILLYDGAGFSGTLLGAGTFGALHGDYDGWADVPFPSVSLVPGQLYTARIADDTVRWGVATVSNVYAGGNSFFSGAPYPAADLTFRVLVPDAVVPEPGSLGLTLIGIFGALAHARVRRKSVRRT